MLLLLTVIIGAPLIMSRGNRADVAGREGPWTVNYFGLMNLASVLQKDNRLEEACDALTKALRLALTNQGVPEDVRSETFLKRSKLLEHMGRHVEARADFLRAKNIPARDPKCPLGAIDLTAYYNAGLTKAWHGDSLENTLLNLPAGVQQFKGVPFDVRGLIQLASDRTKSWKDSDFPRAVRQIKVGRPCRRLHFLHAASERPRNGKSAVGSYVIHFANQQTWEIPLVYGRDLRDWWAVGDEPREAKEAVIAWEGSNGAVKKLKFTIRVFKSTWTSPEPYAEVDTIDFVSTMSGPAPFLIAITLE